jgi:hypothetical protein
MSRLQRTLRPFLPGLAQAGDPDHAPTDRQLMQEELRRCRDWYERWFYVCGAAFLVLFCLELAWVVIKRDDPAAMRATLAASGVGVMGTVWAMVRLWMMKARTDMVIALLTGLDGDALRASLSVLVAKV